MSEIVNPIENPEWALNLMSMNEAKSLRIPGGFTLIREGDKITCQDREDNFFTVEKPLTDPLLLFCAARRITYIKVAVYFDDKYTRPMNIAYNKCEYVANGKKHDRLPYKFEQAWATTIAEQGTIGSGYLNGVYQFFPEERQVQRIAKLYFELVSPDDICQICEYYVY